MNNNIVIVGGGSSGWMTATTLVSQFPDKRITLIESPLIETVGVGESTVGGINDWMQLVGINSDDFMRDCDATYKLSIRFDNFYRKNSGFFHYPFGYPFVEGNRAETNDWHLKKMLYPETPVSDYADCMFPNMALVNRNKITKNKDRILPNFNFLTDTAYQFDATKFGLWLKEKYCLPKGVNHITSEVREVIQNEDGIDYLLLEDGKKVRADLFIDCTGFKALLIDKTLNEPFESWEDILPNNSAWATKIPYKDKEKELVTYTKCEAIENGWVWHIPLWSRMGCGYVYSDKFISDDDALKEFQSHISREDLEFKKLKMRIGFHKRVWVKNVCAIGLSAGFIEPLESTGLMLTHEGLFTLTRVLQREYCSQWDRDEFSTICKYDYRRMAEFVSMHFALSHRDDTEYWRDIQNREWCESMLNLTPTLADGFRTAVFNRHTHFRLWSNISPFISGNGGLHCIAAGMHWFPTDKPSLKYHNADRYDSVEKQCIEDVKILDERKKEWANSVRDCKSHYQFLKGEYN